MSTEEARTCARCGAVAQVAVGGLPDGWSLASDRRGVAFHCATCTRGNIRSIEGKLDQEWWER